MRTILPRYPNNPVNFGVDKPASEEIPKDPGGHPWLSQHFGFYGLLVSLMAKSDEKNSSA